MKLAPHLNQELFSTTVEQQPNRVGFGAGLLAAGEKDDRIVALSADLTGSTKTSLFAETFPERFVQVGIAEQNMASVASGMAAMGKVPFIASYAMFSPGRSWEQVRTTIAYNDSNVKIIGAHAGVSVGPDGATHQAVEDMAIMRVMPNMIVIAPCDTHEAKRAVLWAAEYQGPVYIRVAREATPVMTTPESPFLLGKGELYAESIHDTKQVALISCGPILHEALKAAQQLEQAGVGIDVYNFSTVKPLDAELLNQIGAEYNCIATLEEHQAVGGLGSAIAEHVSMTSSTRIIRIGIDDQFGQSGTMPELYAHYGLDADSVAVTIQNYLTNV